MSALDRFSDGMGHEDMVLGLLSTVAHVSEVEARRALQIVKDAYAHELAEKQRQETRSGTFILRTERPEDPSALIKAMGEHLADLIDPTKENDG